MSVSGLLLGFLNMALTCAFIIFVAYVIVWVVSWFGKTIDGNVYKFGQIIVGLLCLLVILSWLFAVLGGGGSYHSPLLRW